MATAARAFLLVVVWLMSACSGLDETESLDRVIRSDSAGVELVSVPPAALESLPLIALDAPDLILGWEGGPPEAYLGRVADATRLGDGRIAVADALSRRIVIFSGSGSHLGFIGGPGQGPGEFESLTRVAPLADTLLVFDPRAWRISTFGPDGSLHEEVRVSPHTEFADKKFGRPGRDQVFVSWTRSDPSAGSGTVTGPLTDSLTTVLDRVDASGIERVDSLRVTRLGYAIFSQAEYDRLAAASSDRFAIAGVLPLPFENRVLIAALPDEVLVAESGPFEIRRLDGAGNLVQIVHVRATQRSGTEYSLGVLSDWYVSSFSDRTVHHIARHLLNGTGSPQRLAHFSDIRGGADGALWLNVDAGPALGERAEWYDWLKIGRDGTPSLTVRLPASLQVLEFGTNHVIGVLRDALEVETIGVYEFGSFEEAA